MNELQQNIEHSIFVGAWNAVASDVHDTAKSKKLCFLSLTHIEEAQHWLQQRTLERMRRGVEGTHVV